MRPDRNRGRLVAPVLDQPAVEIVCCAVTGDPIQAGGVIRAEPREDRHVMRPGEDVDRVELDRPQPADQARDLVDAWRSGRSRAAKALSGEGNPAGPREAQLALGAKTRGSRPYPR